MRLRHLALPFAFGLAACSSGGSIADRASGKAAKGSKSSKSDVDDDEAVGDDGSDGKEGDDPDDVTLAKDGADVDIQYPTYTLKSQGYTTYTMDDHLDMSMTIETTMAAERVTVDAKAAKVLCGKLSGCNQGDVDEDVTKNVLGAHVFEIVPRDELSQTEEYKDARYSFFSKSFKSKKGIQFTADKPLPINVFPGEGVRYDPLDGGSRSFTARVTSDTVLPKQVGIDLETLKGLPEVSQQQLGIKELTVTIKVSKADAGDGLVKITLETTIAEDSQRLLYTYFPVGRSSTYTIDTKKQDLTAVSSLGWANGNKSHQAEETHLEHQACAKKAGGKTIRDDC